LVLPADLNQHGHLFGGRMLAWVDECAWIAASIAEPQCRFVTIALNEVRFHHPVRAGTILAFSTEKQHQGTSSVTFRVTVHNAHDTHAAALFVTDVTFVNIDAHDQKAPIQPAHPNPT